MEPNNDTPFTNVVATIESGHAVGYGGDVRSDAATIQALRQGVEIDRRITMIDVVDHLGATHSIPLTLDDTETGVGVAVHVDAIAEVEKRAAGPRRRTGSVQLGSLESLIEYVNRFKRPAETVAFAPLQPAGVTVIVDYHPAGGEVAAWREDRATFACPISRQWKLWTEAAGKPQTQVAFGDFVEANADDLGPGSDGFVSAPDLLKVARELAIHSVGTFSRTVNPTSGEGSLVVKDEHDAVKSTKIPKAFRLAIPVFEGSTDLYSVECRIRFAMDGGRPVFAFLVHNQAQVWEHALAELRTKLATACAIPVYVGTPPASAR